MMSFTCTACLLITSLGQVQGSSPESAILLDDYAPCGLTTLYLVSRIRQEPASWQQVKQALGRAGPGGELNFADMVTAAQTIGLNPIALESGREALENLPMPAIVQVHDSRFPDELPHFLVLLRAESDGVWLLDAPLPAYFLPEERFQQSWTGKVMVFAEDEGEASRIRGIAQTPQLIGSATWILLVGGVLLIGYMIIKWLRRRGPSIISQLVPTAQRLCGQKQGSSPNYLVVGTLSVLFLVGGGFAAILVRHSSKHLGPECAFADSVLELGELKPGGQKVRVSIENKGGKPLDIAEIQSSCSCAVAKHPTSIPPHDSANIDVELNVPPGPGDAYLTVMSNDPRGPKHVSLRWHGKTEPFLNPRWIAESGVRLDQPYERTVYLLYPGGKSALQPQLEAFECANKYIELQPGRNDPLATKLATSGLLTKILGQLELHLNVKPPSAPGVLQTVCLLKIKYGEAHLSVRLPILLAFSGGQLSPSATAVTFSAANRQELLSQVRTISISDEMAGSDLELSGVPDWLSCKVERKTHHGQIIHLQLLKAPAVGLTQQTLVSARKNGSRATIRLRLNVLTPGL
jgi:hypothetical protein